MHSPIFARPTLSTSPTQISTQKFLVKSLKTEHQFFDCCCPRQNEQIDYNPPERLLLKTNKISMKNMRRNKSRSSPSADSFSATKSKKTTATHKISIKNLRKETEKVRKTRLASPISPHTNTFHEHNRKTTFLSPDLTKARSMELLPSRNIIVNRCTTTNNIPLPQQSQQNNIEEQFNHLFYENNGNKEVNIPYEKEGNNEFFENKNKDPNLKNQKSGPGHFSFGKRQKNIFLQKFKTFPNIPINESNNVLSSEHSKQSKRVSIHSYQIDVKSQEEIQKIENIIKLSDQQSINFSNGTIKQNTLINIAQKRGKFILKSQSQESIESMVIYSHSSIIKNMPEEDKNISELLS